MKLKPEDLITENRFSLIQKGKILASIQQFQELHYSLRGDNKLRCRQQPTASSLIYIPEYAIWEKTISHMPQDVLIAIAFGSVTQASRHNAQPVHLFSLITGRVISNTSAPGTGHAGSHAPHSGPWYGRQVS